jgi:hypothetical protein
MEQLLSRSILGVIIMVAVLSISLLGSSPESLFHDGTIWEIKTSDKFEALCFLNALTGDPFYVPHYQRDFDHFSELFTPKVSRSLRTLFTVKKYSGVVLSAFLSSLFSVENSESLSGLLESIDESEKLFRIHRDYGIFDWKARLLFDGFLKRNLKVVVQFLIDNDFESYLDRNRAVVNYRKSQLTKYLNDKDIVTLIETHVGVPLASNRITLFLVYFTDPHGISLFETNFISSPRYGDDIILRNAIHEMLHPIVDMSDPVLKNAVRVWKRDPFVMERFRNHDRSFGYNTFDGYVEENIVRALELYLSEKAGVSIDTVDYFLNADGGMHVLAGALYTELKEQNFGSTGETLIQFISRIIEVELRAGEVEQAYRRATK